MDPILLALYTAIPAAFVAIGTKVLAGPVIERIVAAVTFSGLSKLSRKTDNELDNELVLEALVAYYGKDHPKVQRHMAAVVKQGAQLGDSSPVVAVVATDAPASPDTALPEPPKQPQRGSQEVSRSSQEQIELDLLR